MKFIKDLIKNYGIEKEIKTIEIKPKPEPVSEPEPEFDKYKYVDIDTRFLPIYDKLIDYAVKGYTYFRVSLFMLEDKDKIVPLRYDEFYRELKIVADLYKSSNKILKFPMTYNIFSYASKFNIPDFFVSYQRLDEKEMIVPKIFLVKEFKFLCDLCEFVVKFLKETKFPFLKVSICLTEKKNKNLKTFVYKINKFYPMPDDKFIDFKKYKNITEANLDVISIYNELNKKIHYNIPKDFIFELVSKSKVWIYY